MPRRWQHGFTLIELLVVVAIILALLAMLTPALQRAIKTSHIPVCASNLAQINFAFNQFFDSQPVYQPYPYPGNHNAAFPHFWMGEIEPYVSNLDDIRLCPSASKDGGTTVGTATTMWNGKYHPVGYWIHRNEDLDGDGQSDYWYGSYGMNSWMYNSSPWSGPWPGPENYDRNYRGLGAGVSPAAAPTFLDCSWVDLAPRTYDLPAASLQDPYNGGNWNGGMMRSTVDRHLMAVNVALMDGHVEYTKLAKLWSFTWSKLFEPGKGEPAI